jgi:purine-binding chemotaxis protein CheW
MNPSTAMMKVNENRSLLLAGQRGKNTTAYLTFRTGSQWYAVDVLTIFEVSNMVAISQVPDMPDSVLGMVNIRGKVVPVIDLRIRFRVGERRVELTTPIIFLNQAEVGTYGVVVDDVDDVINLKPEVIDTTSLSQRAQHIIGLTDYHGRLIMLLDTVKLLRSTLDDSSLEALHK